MKKVDLLGGGLLEDNKISNFNKFPHKSKNIKKKAFSIAEALVTLMIVGVAMSSAAPLISKTMKNSQVSNFQIMQLNRDLESIRNDINNIRNNYVTNGTLDNYVTSAQLQNALANAQGVPAGTIAHFNLASCPTGWRNVTDLGWGGYFFRVADDSNPRNTAQGQSIQAHSHVLTGIGTTWSGQGGGCPAGNCTHLTTGYSTNWDTSAVGSAETRPRNIPLTTCVRN